jgi:putative phosphoribosyl transferase
MHGVPMAVQIPNNGSKMCGDLEIPKDPTGLVIFVHGSGSSRFSARNRYVAEQLNRHAIGTLLLDLLTQEEHELDEQTRQFRFDIPLLSARSTLAARWVMRQPELQDLPIGLFGASTGAAAALITAAELKGKIAAIVSRGGRPDLAEDALDSVESPTLMIVGGADQMVLELNMRAAKRLHCLNRVQVVPGATHLFEEPGALNQVATVAAEWFGEHLRNRQNFEAKQMAGGR